MAAAMGFSAFGAQGPSKKRKFNPKSDAFIEGQDLAAVDKGGKSGQGSGGNQIPLGKARVIGVPSNVPAEIAGNDDEILLDEEDEGPQYAEEEEEEGPRYLDTSRPAPVEERRVRNEDEIMLDDDDEQGPAGMEASFPPPDQAAREAQERIDAILSGSGTISSDVPTPPVTGKPKQKAKKAQEGGLGAFMAALKTPVVAPSAPGVPPPPGVASTLQMPLPTSLPQRPPPPNLSVAGSVAGSVASSHRPGQRGQRNELWYVGYYDASFNENPWKGLEQENGMPEVGTWIERPQRAQGQMA